MQTRFLTHCQFSGLRSTVTRALTPLNGINTRLLFKRSSSLKRSSPRRLYSVSPQAFLENAVRDSSDLPQPDAPLAVKLPPGDIDRTNFRLHWSVDLWTDFDPKTSLQDVTNDNLPAVERLRSFTSLLSELSSKAGILSDSQATTYWAYHLLRSGFFFTQGFIGLATARAVLSDNQQSGIFSRLENIAKNGWQGPLAEAMLAFYQDYENIKERRYALPWDMTLSVNNRQFNPAFVLSRSLRFVQEAAATLRRRDQNQAEDVWLRSALMPDYFQKTFHYQTDGWLSQSSAKVYEVSTETLFVGRQDAMQRSTLIPISEFMSGKDPSQVKALEVAAGTGRFATFVKDNYPTLDLTVSDLSPFYLAEARSNMKYWKRMRASELELPGVDGTGTTFLQTPAEAIDAPDNTYDIVYCVYLFHELPEDVRRKAASEMARVLKPGGMLVLTDSMQKGDRSVYSETMGNFGDFNEPFYRNYVETDLGGLFKEAGLQCDMKVLDSTSKALSFIKPVAVVKEEVVVENNDQAPLGDSNMN